MTLALATYYTRNAIKYGAFFIAFLIFAKISWEAGTAVYRNFFPPEPPPPEVKFGKLPALVFPEKESPKLSYNLQTATGELPQFPKTTRVYFMPKRSSSFLDLDESKRIAQRLGFSGNVSTTSETIYRFEHETLPSSLSINIVNKTFSLNYDLVQTPSLIEERPESTQEALKAATSFLNQANLMPEDILNTERTFEFWKAETEMEKATSLSEANFIRVNFFREPYDDFPVLTPDRRGNVWFLVGGKDNDVVAGEYHYFPIEKENNSTYPIKTSQQAWEELNQGIGFIVSTPLEQTTVIVRKIYLGYYDAGEPQGFLQPIVVFEGDGNFMAYVPAVTAEFYGSPPQE